jgi:hypothetical protein
VSIQTFTGTPSRAVNVEPNTTQVVDSQIKEERSESKWIRQNITVRRRDGVDCG